jgi:osmotically-inducible protein OsmY
MNDTHGHDQQYLTPCPEGPLMKTDLDLKRDVERELEYDPSIDPLKIGVAVTDGIVTLTGHVASFVEKWNASRAVERVIGVRGIVDEITVVLAIERTDADLARAAADALKWNTLVPEDRVKVKIENGWLTLVGDVSYDYQRRAAERAVRALPGLKGTTNLLEVRSAVEPTNVKQQIEEEFKRQAALDANNITVEVSGHEVTLRGTVRSWIERHETEKAALAAPGVTSVKNYITIRYPAAA